MGRGRPSGIRNRAGHEAGGSRKGAGRPTIASKDKTQSRLTERWVQEINVTSHTATNSMCAIEEENTAEEHINQENKSESENDGQSYENESSEDDLEEDDDVDDVLEKEETSFWSSNNIVSEYLRTVANQVREDVRKKEKSFPQLFGGHVWIRAPEASINISSFTPNRFMYPNVFLWLPKVTSCFALFLSTDITT